MKTQTAIAADNSTKSYLQALAQGRGEMMTDDQYWESREAVLQQLAKPPRIDRAVLGPWLLGVLLGIGLWVGGGPKVAGVLLVVLGIVYPTLNYRRWRAVRRRPYAERVSEIDELLGDGLITEDDYERIKRVMEQEHSPSLQ